MHARLPAGRVQGCCDRVQGAAAIFWCCPCIARCCAVQMLEDNQVLVQGMMANRYMNTFREPVLRCGDTRAADCWRSMHAPPWPAIAPNATRPAAAAAAGTPS